MKSRFNFYALAVFFYATGSMMFNYHEQDYALTVIGAMAAISGIFGAVYTRIINAP